MPPALLHGSDRRGAVEFLVPAAVILAGVLLVVAFGVVLGRVVRDDDHVAVPPPQPPALAHVPAAPADQAVIPLPSPSPSSASPVPSATTRTPPPRTGTTTPGTTTLGTATPAPVPQDVTIGRGGASGTVDLSGEGRRDWVHWGQAGTYSLERARDGDFQILEGAPTAPRFRHGLSPHRFRWQDGSPVDGSDGTPTGIRTCDEGNGFTLSAPATGATRVLKLYVGAVAARGRLEARLSTGGETEVARLEQRDKAMGTAVFEVTYRASGDGRIDLSWITEKTFGGDCSGVALQAATLR